MQRNPNAKLVVAPSDHLILKENLFAETINKALAEAENSKLVTLGIQPSRPDTGYGYIEVDANANLQPGDSDNVLQFREKPDLATAESFLASGNFFWNSGIFIGKRNNSKFSPRFSTSFVRYFYQRNGEVQFR